MRERRRTMGLAAALAALMLASISPLASAAPVKFGSTLDPNDTQPDGGTRTCPSGATCTWIMGDAYHNPDGVKAPKDGTIKVIRVIGGIKGGTFRPVLARVKNHGFTAKVVRRGPSLSYVGRAAFDEPPYLVQKFNVNITVHKGDVLGVEAKHMSLINCSGADLPRYKPLLPVGGGFRSTTKNEGCSLLIQAQYR